MGPLVVAVVVLAVVMVVDAEGVVSAAAASIYSFFIQCNLT